jgi:hypothetical protein
MKFHLEIGKVRWWLVGLVVGAFVIGFAGGVVHTFNQPTLVNCNLRLPDEFQIPSRS